MRTSWNNPLKKTTANPEAHFPLAMKSFLSFSRNVSTYSEFVEAPVPSDVLWEVVTDVEASPEILPRVINFEYIRPSESESKLALGTRYREVVECRGKKHTTYKTITRFCAHNLDDRFISVGVSFKNPDGESQDTIVNTSTLSVQPIDGTSSRLLLTVSVDFSLGGWKNIAFSIFCRSCIGRMIRAYMRDEIDCYRQEAVKRFGMRASTRVSK